MNSMVIFHIKSHKNPNTSPLNHNFRMVFLWLCTRLPDRFSHLWIHPQLWHDSAMVTAHDSYGLWSFIPCHGNAEATVNSYGLMTSLNEPLTMAHMIFGQAKSTYCQSSGKSYHACFSIDISLLDPVHIAVFRDIHLNNSINHQVGWFPVVSPWFLAKSHEIAFFLTVKPQFFHHVCLPGPPCHSMSQRTPWTPSRWQT